MRLGLFGGTFDPPHRAHLALCEAAQNQLRLERIEMTPSRFPPHRKPPVASGIDRYAMVTLLTRDQARIVPSPRELLREGVSYTVDTLRELHREHPKAQIFLLLGGDSYDDLPNWREAKEIVSLAHLAVAQRPGAEGLAALRAPDRPRLMSVGADPPRDRCGIFEVSFSPLPWSASQIRARLATGSAASMGLDPQVLHYIEARGLYGKGRHR